MYIFKFYGLDAAGRIGLAETIKAENLDMARRTARERLREFDKVELWQNSVCVTRERRDPEPALLNVK